jgi:hypothetical protein
LAFGTLGVEAQYSGRRSVRCTNEDSVFTVRSTNDWSQDHRDGRAHNPRADRRRFGRRASGRSDSYPLIREALLDGTKATNVTPLPVLVIFATFGSAASTVVATRLVQEVSNRNSYVAVVNIQDPQGGDEGYTFDLDLGLGWTRWRHFP